MKYTVDGRWTVAEQRDAIQFKENLAFIEMIDFRAGEEEALSDDQGNTFPLNVATFRDWNGSAPCPELRMVTIPSKDDIAAVTAQNAAEGRKVVCVKEAYVGGKKAIVGCFR